VKDLLPFRFRYAAVQNNGTRQTALGSNMLTYFAKWRRMALEAKWLSVKGLLPFHFRYATVQNNGTRQTALGSHIFAKWRRAFLEVIP